MEVQHADVSRVRPTSELLVTLCLSSVVTIGSTTMSRNKIVFDDDLWVCDSIDDDNVLNYKTTFMGNFIGEQELFTSAQAIVQLIWCHKSVFQVTE